MQIDHDRIQRALCPTCNPNHILDNGRLWYFCGLQKLADEFTEEELKQMVPKETK